LSTTTSSRHGRVPVLIYAPSAADIAAAERAGRRPPVHVRVHGGGFFIRYPEQDHHVCKYLASETGIYVVSIDYSVGPQAQYPVAEHQVYDVATWVRDTAGTHGWDADRMTIGGASSGGKLAINIVQQAIDSGEFAPIALSVEFGACDMAKPDSERISAKQNPIINAALLGVVRGTHFADQSRLTEPLASPARYDRLAEFPPTLVLTGELDTLRWEMEDFAADLKARDVEVTVHVFPDTDHGFTHYRPESTVRAALTMMGDHLKKAYALHAQ
jgi:acetyl esterase